MVCMLMIICFDGALPGNVLKAHITCQDTCNPWTWFHSPTSILLNTTALQVSVSDLFALVKIFQLYAVKTAAFTRGKQILRLLISAGQHFIWNIKYPSIHLSREAPGYNISPGDRNEWRREWVYPVTYSHICWPRRKGMRDQKFETETVSMSLA